MDKEYTGHSSVSSAKRGIWKCPRIRPSLDCFSRDCRVNTTAFLVSSRDGASLAMLLTLEIDAYIARSRVLKERSLRGMEAVGRDLAYAKTGTISKVALY